jgi:hypothetical protein
MTDRRDPTGRTPPELATEDQSPAVDLDTFVEGLGRAFGLRSEADDAGCPFLVRILAWARGEVPPHEAELARTHALQCTECLDLYLSVRRLDEEGPSDTAGSMEMPSALWNALQARGPSAPAEDPEYAAELRQVWAGWMRLETPPALPPLAYDTYEELRAEIARVQPGLVLPGDAPALWRTEGELGPWAVLFAARPRPELKPWESDSEGEEIPATATLIRLSRGKVRSIEFLEVSIYLRKQGQGRLTVTGCLPDAILPLGADTVCRCVWSAGKGVLHAPRSFHSDPDGGDFLATFEPEPGAAGELRLLVVEGKSDEPD